MANTDEGYNELLDLFHHGRRLTYDKGEIILRAGDTPQGIYLIESGHVKIYALSKQGDEHTHMFYHPGNMFPMLWAFKDAVRNVYYQALMPTTLWLVPREELMEFLKVHPAATMTLLQQAVEMFRLYAGRIDNLLYSNSYERTAYRLLSITTRFGEKTKDGFVINTPVTHHDLASTVNLTRETVSRGLERMRRKGIIGYDSKRRIVVKDIAALAHIIGEDEAIGMWPELAPYIKT